MIQPLDGANALPKRIVADLSFPEAFVLWALRRVLRGAGGREALVPTFRRAFGGERFETAIEAFCALCGCVERGSRQALRINPLPDENLTGQEESLIAILSALQSGEADRARLLTEWQIGPEARRHFTAPAARFATLLRKAGKRLPSRPATAPACRRAGRVREEHLPAPDRLADLGAGEILVLRGLRTWVAYSHHQADPFGPVARLFQAQGIDGAAEALNSMLDLLAIAGRHRVEVACPRCPGIADDEMRVLHALSSLQRQQIVPAQELLSAWLVPGGARLALRPFRALALSLTQARVTLPLRIWPRRISPSAEAGGPVPLALVGAEPDQARTLH